MQRGVIVTKVTLPFSFDIDIAPGHDSTGIKIKIEVLQKWMVVLFDTKDSVNRLMHVFFLINE